MKSKLPALLALGLPLYAHASISTAFNDPALWTDETGSVHTLQDWSQQPVVLTMIYGDCKKTCPNLTWAKLREIQKALDARKVEAQFIIGTFDPNRDTAPMLRRLKRTNGMDRNNWHLIRGNLADTHRLAQALGLGDYFEMDDHIVHRFRIVYFDPRTKSEEVLDYDHRDVQHLFKPSK